MIIGIDGFTFEALGIVNETVKDSVLDSRMSFYDKAAWYILFIPFASVAIGFVVLKVMQYFPIERSEQDNIGQVVLLSALFVQLVNLVLGYSICYRTHQHRRKLTIWIAIIGIVATVVLGTLTVFALLLTGLGHGC